MRKASSSGRAQPTVQMCVGVSMRGQFRRLGAGLSSTFRRRWPRISMAPMPLHSASPCKCMDVAAIEIRTFLENREHHPIAVRHLLDIEIAAMGSVVDGEHAAGDGGHADDADHRLGFELEGVAPMDDSLLDPHIAILDAEFLAPAPSRGRCRCPARGR